MKTIIGDVSLDGLYLTELPGWLREVEVVGTFSCDNNLLTTLKNSPRIVRKGFSCSHNNRLTSLKGSPIIVGGSYNCTNNLLLQSLEGITSRISGHFWCFDNPALVSIIEGPTRVGGSYIFTSNGVNPAERDIAEITSVKGNIIVSDNLF